MLMTPPASPPLTSNLASVSRSVSHSSVVSASVHHPHHSSSSKQQLISNISSSTAAALNRIAQVAHSWRPEEARLLAEQAWQNSLYRRLAYSPTAKSSLFTDAAASTLVSSSPANNTSTTDTDGESMGFYRSYN